MGSTVNITQLNGNNVCFKYMMTDYVNRVENLFCFPRRSRIRKWKVMGNIVLLPYMRVDFPGCSYSQSSTVPAQMIFLLTHCQKRSSSLTMSQCLQHSPHFLSSYRSSVRFCVCERSHSYYLSYFCIL